MLQKLSKRNPITKDLIQSPNLTDRLSAEDHSLIGGWVKNGYEVDNNSRSVWLRRNEAGMDLVMLIQKDKNFPWPGCANVNFPLIAIAALQFKARSSDNILKGNDPVNYRVIGEEISKEIEEQSTRISRHMSWQVMEEDRDWENEHNKLLLNLAVMGCAFTKTFWHSGFSRIVSQLVLAKNLIINYWAKSLEDASRVSELIYLSRNEIHERIMNDTFHDIRREAWYNSAAHIEQNQTTARHDKRTGTVPPPNDEETPFTFIEQHRWLDLDHDGYAEPYIVTQELNTNTVVRVVSRIDDEAQVERKVNKEIIKIRPTHYYTKYTFIPAMDGGMYDTGFGTLLGGLNESVNSAINQLLDAGTAQNSMGGFLGRGAKIRGGVYTMSPWEWKRVDSSGDDLRKNLVPNPERRPNTTMYQMLVLLIEYTERLSSVTDQQQGKLPGQNTPASTYQTSLEQGMVIFSDIFRGVWRSLKEEFKIRHILNRMYMPSKVRFGESNEFIYNEDYKTSPDHVVPTADPNITSTSMRLFQAQNIRAASRETPGYDMDAVEMNFLRAMRVQNPRKIFPGADKFPPPKDPKMAIEEMKLQAKKMELQQQMQVQLMQLMEDRRLNSAKIIALEAQAYKSAKEAEAAGQQIQLDAMMTVIEVLKGHGEALDQRINTLKTLEGEASKNDVIEGESSEVIENGGEPTDSDTGGVPALEAGPGDAGLSEVPPDLEGELEGAMGGGDVSDEEE